MTSKKQYYLVLHGYKSGLYRQWSGKGGAEEQVKGFAGAIYKGFARREEAIEWLAAFDRDKLAENAPELFKLLGQPVPPPRPPPDEVTLYTDGSALRNPGPGGYGVVLRYKGHYKELSGGFRRTTNNRMELLACIEGLKILSRRCRVILYSDSKYVINGMTKGWVRRWQARDWTLLNGEPAKNVDLWQQLYDLCQRHDVEFRWVRGHSGDPDNERCDQLAVAAAQGRNLAVDAVYEAENRIGRSVHHGGTENTES
ncbi:MAG: ribonuclease HI [Chloroflexi bacterium]|nr:ribonuclease HI [Chloroflexota bacterium]